MAYKCQGYSLSLPVFVRKAHRKEQSEQARQTLFEFVPTALQICPKVSLKLGGVFFLPAERRMADPLPHSISGILLRKDRLLTACGTAFTERL